MKSVRLVVAGAAIVAGCLLGCGKSQEEKQERLASPAVVDTSGVSAIGDALAARGFTVVQNRATSSQRSGSKASLVVYRTGDGGQGGVIYALRPNDLSAERIGWHWYFTAAAPDSAVVTELNRDGLWDIRLYFGDRTEDFVQGESFSLVGRERNGAEVLNGPSSAPADLWKCFDGDSTTAWRSPKDGAFIEVPVPLGLKNGEMDVQLSTADRPSKLEVHAGGRRLQTIDLSDSDLRQSFGLDPAVRDAGSIRVEVKGGRGDAVAISELEIR